MRFFVKTRCFSLMAIGISFFISQGTLLAADLENSLDRSYEYRFGDGVGIRVHYNERILKRYGENSRFAKEVLDSAVQAYQTITQFEGFSTAGFSFADPDKSYAYDPDKTIDIYLGDSSNDASILSRGFNGLSFKDAPCFDTLKVSETAYEAVILLPANYREFIKNWEKINPSSLGTRNVNVDLRGTLIHEMLHVILFYYNKNLNKDSGFQETMGSGAGRKVDWYVEGLARYFETFAGARHDFFSQGFKQTLPDKIRFSRGGSNYFMRYPDQPFTDLRYENALFWRFIDHNYGMPVIEKLSRDFRNYSNQGFESSLEKATKTPFNKLLKTFAMAILLKDFGLKDDEAFLKEIAKTHLVYANGDFYILDGDGGKNLLGKICRTDWVGKWENMSAKFGEPGVAGDNTEKADVSGWATDYVQIDLDPSDMTVPDFGIAHKGTGLPLEVQSVIMTKGGSLLTKDIGPVKSGAITTLHLKDWLKKEGLQASDIDKMYLLLTNTDPRITADYEIVANP